MTTSELSDMAMVAAAGGSVALACADGSATAACMNEHDISAAVNAPATFKKGRFTIFLSVSWRVCLLV